MGSSLQTMPPLNCTNCCSELYFSSYYDDNGDDGAGVKLETGSSLTAIHCTIGQAALHAVEMHTACAAHLDDCLMDDCPGSALLAFKSSECGGGSKLCHRQLRQRHFTFSDSS
jgi:hypothetical protein